MPERVRYVPGQGYTERGEGIDRTARAMETTGAQLISGTLTGGELHKAMPATYKTYRTMRKDPTIAMVRALTIATVVLGEWSVEADDDVTDEEIQFVQDNLLKWRTTIVRYSLEGTTDFGWQPFEVVWGPDTKNPGKIGIVKVKPLLQDLTTILVDQATGALVGYRQRSIDGQNVSIFKPYILHVAFRVEGTDWYGDSLLENARETLSKWWIADEGAKRYDKKVAGSHFVVYYPIGKSLWNGTDTDNAALARLILNNLESSGSVTIPIDFIEQVGDDNQPKWKIEILEDKSSKQATFIDRLKYLDSQKVRAMLVPERAVTEGTYGTKAEAETHGSIATDILQLADRDIADTVNEDMTDPLLILNYGEEKRGKIRIVPAPLSEERQKQLQSLYDKLLTNPTTLLEEYATIDTDAIKDQLAVPKRDEVADPLTDGIDPTEDSSGVPGEGPTREQLSLVAGYVPRTEQGRWTYDGGGLVLRFGPSLAVVDDTFRQARRLANAGKYKDARQMLFDLMPPEEKKAAYAVELRRARMLERFGRMELGYSTSSKKRRKRKMR